MPRTWSSSALAVPALMVVLLRPRADASGASRLAVARPSVRVVLVVVMLASASLFLLEAALARSRPPPASQYSLRLEPDDAAARARLAALIRTPAKRFGAPRSRRTSRCSAASPAARSAARARSSARAARRVARAVRDRGARGARRRRVEPGRARRGRAQRRARRGARRARGAFLGDATERFGRPGRAAPLAAVRRPRRRGATRPRAARDSSQAACARPSARARSGQPAAGYGVRGWHGGTFPLEGGPMRVILHPTAGLLAITKISGCASSPRLAIRASLRCAFDVAAFKLSRPRAQSLRLPNPSERKSMRKSCLCLGVCWPFWSTARARWRGQTRAAQSAL